MTDLEVRPAEPADAHAVGEVHQRAIAEHGPRAYTDRQVAAWRDGREPSDYEVDPDEEERLVVAERGGEVVGFGALDTDPDGEYDPPVDAEVNAVYVHPDHARTGVGSTLLADLEAAARERGADCVGLHASLNAVPFYERRGYRRVRERDHEFGGGAEGTVVEMQRELA